MTPEDLEAIVVRGDGMAVAEALESLTERERRTLSNTAAVLLRELERYYQTTPPGVSEVMRRLMRGGFGVTSIVRKERAAEVAVLGLCPISVTRKVAARAPSDDDQFHDAVVKVLTDRRPDWINEWLDERFKGAWPTIRWDVFWELYKAGACQKPTSDDYYRYMATQLDDWVAYTCRQTLPLSEILGEEPALLDDVWKFFEVETVAFTDYWGDGNEEQHESWTTALCRLAERGVVDRGRLLDATLGGLASGLKQVSLTGFARLHERLNPTLEEITSRQAAYADLLNVKVNQVVSFSIKMLKKIDQIKRLDDASFVTAAPSVFDIPTKGPAKSTMGLFKKIAKRSPTLQGRIAGVLVESALAHPANDIVLTAVELIGGWREKLEPGTIQSLADTIPDLPAVAQPLARELVSAAGTSVEVDARSADELAHELADVRSELDAIDLRWRRLAGVDEALAAVESRIWPAPLCFAIHQTPVLSGVEQITPIESIDELRDVIAHSVELVDSALDFERILDGMSRLGREDTPEFDRLAAPLVKRIRERPYDESGRSLAIWGKTPVAFFRLLEWWLGDSLELIRTQQVGKEELWGPGFMTLPVHRFLNRRCMDLHRRLADGHRGPFLSMPTHQSGWIDPRVLVQRWHQSVDEEVPFVRCDAVLGLLRLAPDNRPAALQRAAERSHPWASALRWALGEHAALARVSEPDADLWIAAANARGGDDAFRSLRDAGVLDAGPNGSTPAVYKWQADIHEWKQPYEHSTPKGPSLRLSVQPQVSAMDTGVERPSVQMHVPYKAPYWHDSVWMIDLLATIHPGDVSGQYAAGVTALMSRIDQTGSAWEPNYPYLRPLFDVDRPISDLGSLLLVLGLCGRDQDVRGLAIDAAVESIQDGRLHPDLIGSTLSRLAIPGWLKLNRLCPNLLEVARIGPLHAWVVSDSLQRLLGSYQELPRDAHHLLSLLQELLVQLGSELQVNARKVLLTANGSGKTARLAKSIIKLSAKPTLAADEARQKMLQARLDRARRWNESAR